jgi:restriction system protein
MNSRLLHKVGLAVDKFEKAHLDSKTKNFTGVIREIFEPLFKYDGFLRDSDSMRRHTYLHYVASKDLKKSNKQTIGVAYKKEQAVTTKDEIEQLVAGCTIDGIDSLVFISTSPVDEHAGIFDEKLFPVKFQSIDFGTIRNWVSRVAKSLDESEVSKILRSCTQKIIEIVLENPEAIDELEWRDVERLIAELFRGLGFDVQLTSSSKDGGKDVVLEFKKKDQNCSYIVEIKHWTSRQKVGRESVMHFINVITREKRSGGLFLSTYGFADSATQSLTTLERKKVRFAGKDKIISLCETYVKGTSGLWLKDSELEKVLLEKTF